MDVKITTAPDGRIIASSPRTDGPKAAEYPAPGELGKVLEEHGYRARVVIERLDGGAITDADRVVLNDATAAAEAYGSASPQVRERVVAGHLARSRARLAAKGAPARKAG
jgi:hypothetical protein